MARLHIFDSHVAVANRWIKELIENLDLPPADHPRALRALRVGLHVLRDRLPASEVLDLGAQLPTLIRGLYFEGWTLHRDTKQIRDRSAMIARIQEELGSDQRLDPVDVLRAVIHLLVQHVSGGEIRDVIATLPKPIADLWGELTGHARDIPLPPPPSRAGLTRRTGYSR